MMQRWIVPSGLSLLITLMAPSVEGQRRPEPRRPAARPERRVPPSTAPSQIDCANQCNLKLEQACMDLKGTVKTLCLQVARNRHRGCVARCGKTRPTETPGQEQRPKANQGKKSRPWKPEALSPPGRER